MVLFRGTLLETAGRVCPVISDYKSPPPSSDSILDQVYWKREGLFHIKRPDYWKYWNRMVLLSHDLSYCNHQNLLEMMG